MLREIEPVACKQFITQTSPALVITIVKVCYLPPFKYIGIIFGVDSVKAITEPMLKEEIETMFDIKL